MTHPHGKNTINNHTGDYEWVKGKGWQPKQKKESLACNVTESIIRKLNESNAEEEPYLWIEVSHYDDGSEVAYELDSLVKKNVDAPMPSSELGYYDYNNGETPDDFFEYVEDSPFHRMSIVKAVSDDGYYVLIQGMMGDYSLYRKAYLGEIIELLSHMEGLPYNASNAARKFVEKYCPQFLESGEEEDYNPNESLSRRVTESIIRKLRRLI